MKLKLVVAVVFMTVLSLFGQAGYRFAGTGGTPIDGASTGTSNSFYIIPLGNGAPIITYLAASCVGRYGTLYFSLPVRGGASCTYSNNIGTNYIMTSNTGYASNDIVVVRHVTGAYERRQVWGTSGTTNVITTSAFTLNPAVGDLMWEVSYTADQDNNGKYEFSYGYTQSPSPTNFLATTEIWRGEAQQPGLIECVGTNAVLHYLSGTYK